MLAVSYGWSEEYIFNLPWDRAKVYMDEILIYNEQEVVRKLAPLPEMAELQRLYKIKAAERKKEIAGNAGVSPAKNKKNSGN